MATRFDYLLDRLRAAEFESDPFPHLYLTDFLSEADFKEVTTSRDLDLPAADDLDGLFANLDAAGYEVIEFPGCTTKRSEYAEFLEHSSKPRKTHAACEGQGMTLRLKRPTDSTVQELIAFFTSPELSELLRVKFGIDRPTYMETGIQKYLRGYEISPHPDIRKKALTWMLNMNTAAGSEDVEIHTHYLKMTPERAYVTELWHHNPGLETCWVPWDWCTTVKQQRENNSIVIFSPRWDTVHGIKAHYDHLPFQRTQFFGNLWYDPAPPTLPRRVQFEDLDFTETFQHHPPSQLRAAMRTGAATMKRWVNRFR